MEWLLAARDEKIPWYPWLVAWFPQTQFLYADPRMQQLAVELGIALPE